MLQIRQGVYETKIDGSIVKLWCDRRTDQWQWSTNSVIDASGAHVMDSAVFCYKALGNHMIADKILQGFSDHAICKLINDYEADVGQ